MIIVLYQYFQAAALIVALLCWRALKQNHILLFIPLLLLINAIEIVGNNFRAFGWANNYFVYNYYLLFSTPIWLLLYRQMLAFMGNVKWVFNGIILLITLLLLLNYFFVQGRNLFNTYSLILVMIINVVFSSLVLFRMAWEETVQGPLLAQPYFWINAGNLLFSMVTIVLLGLQQYIRANAIEISRKSLYYAILPSANILLYIGLSYAFILCQIRKSKSSLSL